MQFKSQVWYVCVKTVMEGHEESEYRRFRTFEAAKAYTQKCVANLDISSCTDALRNDEGWEYRNAMADFLEKLISCGCMLDSPNDIPSLSRKDYAVPDYHGFRVKGEDPAPPLMIQTNASRTHLSFSYQYGPRYAIETDLLLAKQYYEDSVSFSFKYDCSDTSKFSKGEYSCYSVTWRGKKERNTAKNAVQIVELLRQSDVPLTQTEIGTMIGIDRKTVCRHINKMIAEKTYNIQRAGKRGYYIAEKASGLTHTDILKIQDSIKKNPSLKPEEKQHLLERLSEL